jgi:hypothetical protein
LRTGVSNLNGYKDPSSAAVVTNGAFSAVPFHVVIAGAEQSTRRILLFPQGNANGQPNDMVSVYLDYANPKGIAEGWHACAQFCLAISNPNDPTIQTSSRKFDPFTRWKH